MRILSFSLALLGLAACGDNKSADTDGSSQIDARPGSDAESPDTGPPADAAFETPPTLTFGTSPVAGLPAGTKFASGVPYGTDPAEVFDVFLPVSATPTALIIYIHGGGFTAGTRTDVYDTTDVNQAIAAGVAFVTLDYRLLEAVGTETEGVQKSLNDSRRALQFIRHFATTFNIDKTKIGLTGVSAGAGTSLWLGYHDDMAATGSADAIATESTRPQVVAVDIPQATYDLLRWAPDVFAGEYTFVTNDVFLSQAALRALVVQFYGLDASLATDAAGLQAALVTPAMTAYRANIDMLALASSDDPPTYAFCSVQDISPVATGFDLLHHPLHDKALIAATTAAGVSFKADVPAYTITSGLGNGTQDETMTFLLDHLAP